MTGARSVIGSRTITATPVHAAAFLAGRPHGITDMNHEPRTTLRN